MSSLLPLTKEVNDYSFFPFLAASQRGSRAFLLIAIPSSQDKGEKMT